jgi:hypothetical protein
MIMVDFVERRGQVGIERPHALGQQPRAYVVDRIDRVMAAAARPEPVRSGLEPGLPLRLQRVTYAGGGDGPQALARGNVAAIISGLLPRRTHSLRATSRRKCMAKSAPVPELTRCGNP